VKPSVPKTPVQIFELRSVYAVPASIAPCPSIISLTSFPFGSSYINAAIARRFSELLPQFAERARADSMCSRESISPITVGSSIRRPSPNSARNKTPRPPCAAAQSNQRSARSQQAVLWKGFGLPKRQTEINANPFEVPPHIAALCGIKIER